ncbi:Hsp20/alpha crystallin family protein [Accumulibacter sp.]|jgi:HSP20 family protein|uniref:Hsp20/alpha crystallin family protein n=1 Tax=Accumulibacter sp. TaxID=2053492 RepID=UPI002C24215A|nr:Hsp20/alpha crystallin family protein [Accumulibacter sp.]HPU80038.1 Hsp20/alpha crystallin family protein [Accumulibacter sp.]
MMYRSLFPRDVLAELNRLQREMQQAFHLSPSIRGIARGGFPAMNVGGTPQSVDIFAFAPGIDPATLDVQIEKGVLTVAGERKRELPGEEATVHIDERFDGRFRRVVTLPDDVDANAVEAKYRDGVLRISIGRKQSAQPRRITIQ